MANDFKLKGMAQVLRNLDKSIKEIENRSLKGLILAAIYLRRDMEKTTPTIPVDFSNLRASWFIVTSTGETKSTSPSFKNDEGGKISSAYEEAKSRATQLAKQTGKPTVVMGFGANYAVFVHEAVDYNFKKAGSGAKFFEAALKRNKEAILKIIQENTLIK